jgi:hypothetical protein
MRPVFRFQPVHNACRRRLTHYPLLLLILLLVRPTLREKVSLYIVYLYNRAALYYIILYYIVRLPRAHEFRQFH